MRTKTLLLAAVLGSASVAGTLAQAVYSVNAVGYVNLTVPAGGALKLICNPLSAPTNTLGGVFPVVPDGTQLYKYGAAGFTAYNFDVDLGWLVNGVSAAAVSVNPGEGMFLRNNDPANPLTVTFVGDVLQGTQTISIQPGLGLIGSKIPQSGGISSTLGFPTNAVVDGTQVYLYNAAGGYDSYNFDIDLGWLLNGVSAEPQLGVAQAFWVKNNGAAAFDWARTFSVNN